MSRIRRHATVLPFVLWVAAVRVSAELPSGGEAPAGDALTRLSDEFTKALDAFPGELDRIDPCAQGLIDDLTKKLTQQRTELLAAYQKRFADKIAIAEGKIATTNGKLEDLPRMISEQKIMLESSRKDLADSARRMNDLMPSESEDARKSLQALIETQREAVTIAEAVVAEAERFKADAKAINQLWLDSAARYRSMARTRVHLDLRYQWFIHLKSEWRQSKCVP